MARDGGTMPPGEAARRLGIAASTLRIYSVKLGGALSASANRLEGVGARRYEESDLRVLGRAKELLGRGMTYGRVLDELRPAGRVVSRWEGEGATGRRGRQNSLATLAQLLEPLKVTLEAANAATQAWQGVAEERLEENRRLRERVASLEGELALERRRPWWSKLRSKLA